MRNLSIKSLFLVAVMPCIGFTLINLFLGVKPITVIIGFIGLIISFLALYFVSDKLNAFIKHEYQYLAFTILVMGITFFLYTSEETLDKTHSILDAVGLGVFMVANSFVFTEDRR